MSALFYFPSLLVVLLLFICLTTFTRSLYPSVFTNKGDNLNEHSGFYGLCWKASRVGERVSQYVCVACVVMALHVLFFQ